MRKKREKLYSDVVSDAYDQITKGVEAIAKLERKLASIRFVGIIEDYANTEKSPEVRKVLKQLLRDAKQSL